MPLGRLVLNDGRCVAHAGLGWSIKVLLLWYDWILAPEHRALTVVIALCVTAIVQHSDKMSSFEDLKEAISFRLGRLDSKLD